MAVFTQVSAAEAGALVARLNLGRLVGFRGIQAGIENSNFFVDTEQDGATRHWVLTLFERLSFQQLPFYLRLMRHLAQRGIPVPEPQADSDGNLLHTVNGKPAAVVDKLAGSHELAPDAAHCAQVGAMLARMHMAARDFELQQPNLRGLAWWRETVPLVRPFLTPDQRGLIDAELDFAEQLGASPAHAALPRGVVHADLFRDNVMFDDRPAIGDGPTALSGFFDFYFAAVDTLLFDLAVCLNDWCIDLATGMLDEIRAQAFVSAYAGVRALDGNERRLLPAMMRSAALRFWVSRLWDLHLPREAALLTAHDPSHFERVLRARAAQPWHPVLEGVAS